MTTDSLTGTGAAVVPLSLDSAALTIQIEGTWTGTIDFEASIDGTTWEALPVYPILPSGAASVTSTTANGTWAVAVNGLAAVQIIGATITGTATVVVNQSTVSLPTSVSGTQSPNAPAFSQTASIGTVSAVLKASAGVLKSVFAANRSAVALWLQFQNQTTAITNAGNAVLQFYVPPNGEIVIGSDFFVGAGWAFSTGISWGFSTVTTTYTAYGTAANVDFQGFYL
jgi:hypothetical protein